MIPAGDLQPTEVLKSVAFFASLCSRFRNMIGDVEVRSPANCDINITKILTKKKYVDMYVYPA